MSAQKYELEKTKSKPALSVLEKKYHKLKCWGLLASIDLYNCEPDIIRDPKKIEQFIIQLCKEIKMNRYGKAMIKRFGEGELEGYSALQFIETSSITMHFDELQDRAFIEIFSCKFFEPKMAEQFCKNYLKAKHTKLNHFFRH